MTRVVEAVAPDFGDNLNWNKVITKDLLGAKRFMALSRNHGRTLPVPSIIIDGNLVFEMTPSQEELKEYLDRLISEKEQP
jgi:hypothetical protein